MSPRLQRREWLQMQRFATESSGDDLWQVVETSQGAKRGAVGANALGIAQAKCQLHFVQAVALGVLGNALVCLAVWLCFSARTTADRLLAVLFPVSAFVAAGFEHSVANLYLVPAGLLVKGFAAPDFWSAAGLTAADYPDLSWPAFLARNLIPVTIGNVLGGGVLVGLVYWFVYLRKRAG